METTALLFPELNVPRHFDGETYEPSEDRHRLSAQLDVVRGLMSNHGWWTIAQLADAVWKAGYRATQQGLSARIRDLRKARFGANTVDRRRRGKRASGEWEYRLVPERELKARREEEERVIDELAGRLSVA